MDAHSIDRLRQLATTSAAVAKIRSASKDLLGGDILFLARDGDEVIEIHPSASEEQLPEFCQLYRANADGLECCTSCRSLLAFGACYRGTLEYSCHGGVRILATPATRSADTDTRVIVASCAFARPEREEGWIEFRDHAHGLGIDLRKLRAAYDRMPVLTESKRHTALALIEIAASLVDDLLGPSGQPASDPTSAVPEPGTDDLEHLMASALYLSHTQASAHPNQPSGTVLVARIREMVSKHAAQAFTVTNVARAAGVTPNHLSTLFHQVTGVTFSVFLLRQRIELAKRLLRDLSLPIEAVARQSGFSTPSYFSRRFRRETGKSPSQWRAEL